MAFECGLNADVLGYLVVVSGTPLDHFFKERIFDPLKMTDTQFFYLSSLQRARLVNLYDGQEHGPIGSTGGCAPAIECINPFEARPWRLATVNNN